jgi:hypothetical protein
MAGIYIYVALAVLTEHHQSREIHLVPYLIMSDSQHNDFHSHCSNHQPNDQLLTTQIGRKSGPWRRRPDENLNRAHSVTVMYYSHEPNNKLPDVS